MTDMLNELKKLPEAEKTRRAHKALIELVDTMGMDDTPSEALMATARLIENYIVDLPVSSPRDVAAKFRFFADMIDNDHSSYPNEQKWISKFSRQLADLRAADKLALSPRTIWGEAA